MSSLELGNLASFHAKFVQSFWGLFLDKFLSTILDFFSPKMKEKNVEVNISTIKRSRKCHKQKNEREEEKNFSNLPQSEKKSN